MSSPVLATKLFVPPPRTPRVHRRRLIDRLNAGLQQRLSLVSAPAGFGKTSVVSEWASEADRPVAWLSLDAGEGDPARFLVHVVSAIQAVVPDLGQDVLGRLQSPGAPPAEHLLTELVNEIAQARQDLILVLDDYHLVDSRPVDAALTFLLDHLPPQLHVVVAAREDPQLPLARYRSRGQLVELREADLRFTPVEAAEFLTGVMGLRLSEQDVAALESRTEGWIVGLQLAALSMQGLPDAAAFIGSFTGTNRFVLDYLLEEVLYRQPQAIQDFLLATSILDRLSGPLCDSLVPESRSSGQEVLEALERANLFVVPLDHERRWYRYHHLFATLLQDRLARTQPDRVAPLNQRASDWFAGNGAPDAAVRHAIAAGDWDRAADVLERFSGEWPRLAGVAATLAWLESIPARLRLARPQLGLTYAWTLVMSNQLDRAERFLGQLTPLVAAEPEHLGEVFAIRLMVAANRHDLDAVVALADDALSLVPPTAPSPRSRILISLGVAFSDFGGDLERAKGAFREAYELGQGDSPPSSVANAPLPLTALAYLAELEWLQGNLQEASRRFEEARALAAQLGDQPSIALGLVQLGRARLLYEWDDPGGAELAARDALRIGEIWSNARLVVPALGLLAVVAHGRGRTDDARAAIRRAALLAGDAPSAPLIQTSVAIHELALYPGETSWRAVEGWQSHFDTHAAALPGVQRDALAIALAGAWIARHDRRPETVSLPRVRSMVEEALAASDRDGHGLHVVRLLIIHSIVLDRLEGPDTAVMPLERALGLAAKERYVRSLLDLGPPAEVLIRRAIDRGALAEPALAYACRLLPRFRPGRASEPAPDVDEPLVEPLTRRELEVLRLIAEGLSNREIAERLFLALSTVKGHARIAFDKLQVRRRTEAVARARELGLV